MSVRFASLNAPPAGYPAELEQSVALSDGSTMFVRAIVPDDADHLRAALADADEATLYSRFFTSNPHLTDDQLAYLTNVDYRYRLAVLGFVGEKPVAVARYEGTPGSVEAEFAVVVDPAWRARHVALILGEILAEAATLRGIERFVAHRLAENTAANALLTRLGYGDGEADAGIVTTWLELRARGGRGSTDGT